MFCRFDTLAARLILVVAFSILSVIPEAGSAATLGDTIDTVRPHPTGPRITRQADIVVIGQAGRVEEISAIDPVDVGFASAVFANGALNFAMSQLLIGDGSVLADTGVSGGALDFRADRERILMLYALDTGASIGFRRRALATLSFDALSVAEAFDILVDGAPAPSFLPGRLDVQAVQPIPLPASMLLLVSGVGLLAMYNRVKSATRNRMKAAGRNGRHA